MPKHPHEKPTPWKITILCLSVYVLLALFYETAFKPGPHVRAILHATDNAVCFLFIADFFAGLYRAERKWEFLRWGWIDLVSSIPTFGFFRIGRAVTVIRILRLLRGFRSVKTLVTFLLQNRAQSAFAAVALISITLVFWASIAILNVETHPDSNIKTAGDALWWSVATIATAGFGDRYPVTPLGRLLGTILLVAGVGLFGTFTGFIASWFLENEEVRQEGPLERQVKELGKKIEELETLIRGMRRE